ncbi:MAG: SusC/RagA family TonB-linked outer membrane protein [Flavisolibacter sp.]
MRKLLILALLCPYFSMCQPLPIEGNIINEQSEPIAGATVTLKRTGQVTVSDNNGHFNFPAALVNDTLVISAVGYETQAVPNNERGQVTIILKSKTALMDEMIINTGYQVLPRERATGSFAKISNALFEQRISTDWLSRLSGITPSVLFDKRPSSREKIQIRGLSTLRSENAAPLIVLDNFPYEGNITNINPADIESITVLKDAAAASIWGARAGNGVIVITTQKGQQSSKPVLTASINTAIVPAPDLFQFSDMSASDFIDFEQFLFNDGYYNFDINNTSFRPPLTPAVEIMAATRSGLISQEAAAAKLAELKTLDVRRDFQDFLYRKAINSQAAFSLSGATPFVRYLLSTGYDKNTSSLVGNDYLRFTLRTDNTFTLNKFFFVNLGLSFVNAVSNQNNPGEYGSYSVGSRRLYPYARLADGSGNPLPIDKNYRSTFTDTAGNGRLFDWKYRPLQELQAVNHNINANEWLINSGFTWRPSRSYSVDLQFRFHKGSTVDRNYNSPQSYFARNLVNSYTQLNGSEIKYAVPPGGVLDLSNSMFNAYNGRLQFNAQKAIGSDHKVNAVIGAEVRQISSSNEKSRTYGYNDDNLVFSMVDWVNTYPGYAGIFSALRIPAGTGFSGEVQRAVSLYGNVAHSFLNRYTISASARRDATNMFGTKTNDQWKHLWSVGAMWDISKESFYNWHLMQNLKFRATYGYSGNIANNISGFTTIVYLNASQSPLNIPAARLGTTPNPQLRWEKTAMLNLGLDFALTNSRVGGSLEFFNKTSNDLIGTQTLDPTTGVSSISANSADLVGRGFDIEINTKNILNPVQWETSFLFSHTSSKITRYQFKTPDQAPYYISNGRSILPSEGLQPYQVVSFRSSGLDPANGDPIGYVNGQQSKDYLAMWSAPLSDLVVHGVAVPPYFGAIRNSFSYKRLSLAANITYRLGYYFRRPAIDYSSLVYYNQTHPDYALRWQKPGDEKFTSVPSFVYPVNDYREGFYVNSEATVFRGDNIRLEYVNLSWAIDKKSWRSWPFNTSQFTMYVNDLNIVLWKKYDGDLDPDFPFILKPKPSIAIAFKTSF